MNINSSLTKELRDKAYRDAYVASQIRVGLPFQVRGLRRQRSLSQGELANLAGMAQPRISEIEKPGERNLNIDTLLRIASGLDVALQISFVPFSKIVEQSENFDPDNFEVPNFETEIAQMESAQEEAQTVAARKASLWDLSSLSFAETGIGLQALARGTATSSCGGLGAQGGYEHTLQRLIGRTQTEVPQYTAQSPQNVIFIDTKKLVESGTVIRRQAQSEYAYLPMIASKEEVAL
jgi:transcriptional regulator with XRE-family HTH domain